MFLHHRLSSSIPGLVLLLLVLTAGCSVESRKSKHIERGGVYLAEGKLEHAELEFRAVLELDLRDVTALRTLGNIAYERGRMGLALVYLQRAKEIAPLDTGARRSLGLVFLSLGNRSEAMQEALAVLEQTPTDSESIILLAESTFDDATLKIAEDRLSGLPQSQPALLVGKGILALKQGQRKVAIEHFENALRVDPTLAAAHSGLGAAFAASGDLANADRSYAQGAALSGIRSPRKLQYAAFRMNQGDAITARTLLTQIIREVPDSLTAKVRLAELSFKEGQTEEASELVKSVLTSEPYHPEGLLLSSRLALSNNNPTLALAETEKLLKLYPRSTEALFEQAKAHLALRELSHAEASLNQVLTTQPDHVAARVALASLYLRQDDRSFAIALLRPWLKRTAPDEIPPELVDAFTLLAEALRGTGELAETLEIYARVEKAVPGREYLALMKGLVLLQQQKLVEARSEFEEALKRNPKSALAIEQLTGLDVAENKTDVARKRLDDALLVQPLSPDLHLLSARLHLAKKDRPMAEAAIQRAIECQPDWPQGFLLLARIQLDSGENTAALKTLQEVVQRSPRNLFAWLLVGTLQASAKNYDLARKAYERVLELQPNHVPALNNLAVILSQHFGEVPKAYELARKARDLAPGDGVVADTLAWIGFQRREYAWAVGLLRESASKLPNDANVLYHLAMALYMMCEEDEAKRTFESALQATLASPALETAKSKLDLLSTDPTRSDPTYRSLLDSRLKSDPGDPVVLYRLAKLHEREGNADAVVELLQKAVQLSPESATLRTRLARSLVNLGRSSDALEQARIARRLAPENKEIALELGVIAYRSNDYPWSYTLLQEATRKASPTISALKALSDSAYAVGRVSEAKEALKSILALEFDPEVQALLEMVEAADSKEQAVRKLELARIRLGSSPNDVPAMMAIVVAGERDGISRAYLERILARFPDFAPAKRHLVVHLFRDPTEDAKCLQLGTQAREFFRTDSEFNRALGMVVFRSGDFRRALGLLESSTEGYRNDAEIWYYVGRCYQELKEFTPAIEALNRAITLGLRGAPAEDAKARLAALSVPRER
ncbi:MAG: tetratricopeptide repeat protein [Opitutaceae bacterium]|nr:tetratricopeptide repeat protein [Opitutaceae bacterium]